MLYDAPLPVYSLPALVEPLARSSRNQFPSCRASGGGQQTVYTCKADPRSEFPDNRRGTGGPPLPAPKVRDYWLLLSNPETLESTVVDASVVQGQVEGLGEVARLASLVASEMPGWEIAGLSLADEPDVEF